MKKGLCIVLSALMIAFSLASCGKKNVSDEPTKVDENGSAYVEVTDKDGNVVASVLSDEEKSKADKKAEKNNKNTTTTTANASEVLSKAEGAMSNLEKVDEKDLESDKKDLIQEGTETKKTSLRDDVIVKTAKASKKTLKAKLKASSGDDTQVTFVVNGKKLAYEVVMKGTRMRAIIDESNMYVVLPDYKWYFKTSTEDMGLGSMDDVMSNITSTDDKYVGSTKVTVSGTEYTCEEYKNSNGTVTKYYFDKNKDWKRVEIIDGDTVTIMEIQSFTATATDDFFSISGYTDITPLIGQLDASSLTTTKKK